MPYQPKGSRFWHYDIQVKGRRFCGSCGTENFEEAKAVEAAARTRARTDPAAKGIFTLSQVIGTYLADISQHQPSYRTSVSQGKSLIAILGKAARADQLTNAHLARYVALRRARVQNATVNRDLDLLARACRYMVRIYHADIPADLDFRYLKLKEKKEHVRELSWDEQSRLFKALRTDLHPLVKLALMTGARKDTLCSLTWSDVDYPNARLRFDMKGDEKMYFPMNGELRAFLTALPRGDGQAAPYVITYLNQISGARCKMVSGGGGLADDFAKACRAAGVTNFRFHDLRHTFGTRLLRKTRNLKLVSELMGHRSIETTMRYAHILDDDLRGGVADFSALTAPESRKKSRSKSA